MKEIVFGFGFQKFILRRVYKHYELKFGGGYFNQKWCRITFKNIRGLIDWMFKDYNVMVATCSNGLTCRYDRGSAECFLDLIDRKLEMI